MPATVKTDDAPTAGDERRFRPGGSAAQVERLRQFLTEAIQRGASDVHIRAGDVVYARIHGQLVPLDTPVLGALDTRELAMHMLATAPNAPTLDEVHDYSGPWSAPGIARFRISILKQRSSYMVVMRVIPDVLPTFETLGLPASLGRAVLAEFGLVLISGVPGSGRTSTLAAIINHLNAHAPARRHIVSVEPSIEFLHKSLKCSVTQREVGIDTDSYLAGMRAALDQDADVVVLGELSGPEMIDMAFRAVEQGRMVIARMQSRDVTSAIKALLANFAADGTLARARSCTVAPRLLVTFEGRRHNAALAETLALPLEAAPQRADSTGVWHLVCVFRGRDNRRPPAYLAALSGGWSFALYERGGLVSGRQDTAGRADVPPSTARAGEIPPCGVS